MATTLDLLGQGKYLSLTTFRADGTPVPTPVWLVRDGDCLRVTTEAGSGKVRRIRADGRVLVAPCDMRGRLTGEAVEATATLDDPARADETARLVTSRYGLMGRFLAWRARRSGSERAGITIRLA